MIVVPLAFRPLVDFASREVVRYALTAVRVSTREKWGVLQASDAKRAIDVRWPLDAEVPGWAGRATPPEKEIVVPATLWRRLPPYAPRDVGGRVFCLSLLDGYVRVTHLAGDMIRTRLTERAIDAPFPDLDAALTADVEEWKGQATLQNTAMLASSLSVVHRLMTNYHGRLGPRVVRLRTYTKTKYPGIEITHETADLKLRVVQMGNTES